MEFAHESDRAAQPARRSPSSLFAKMLLDGGLRVVEVAAHAAQTATLAPSCVDICRNSARGSLCPPG